MQVKAAVLRDREGDFTLEDVELAAPAEGEVLVEIAGVGICHTDAMPRAAGFMAEPPLVLGHEGSGTVVALGPGVTGIRVGMPVVLSFDSCGRCASCADGQPAYCRGFWGRNMVGRSASAPDRIHDSEGAPLGSRWFGQSSFATHALVSAAAVVPVPGDVPLELAGPLACGFLTGAGSVFGPLEVGPGSSLAVYGAGAVGLSAVMAAAAAGATQVIAVDRHPSRLETARELGATDVICVDRDTTDDIGRMVTKLSDGGTLHGLDTTGVPAVIAQAVAGLRPRGRLGLVSKASGDIVLPSDALALGKTVIGILEGSAVPATLIPRLIDLWRAGRFPFDRLITTYPMTEINRAEDDMASGRRIKPVLVPRATA